MSNYIGVRCPVCNKKFSEADDIVVCPVCGAPHHRDCYAMKKQCAFAADHINGKEWRDPAGQIPPQEQQEASAKECTRCGASNPQESIFCQVCGFPLTVLGGGGNREGGEHEQEWTFPGGIGMRVDAISMAYGGLAPEDKIDGESVKDFASYVGGGSAYYLPRFQIMSETGRSFLPSLSAFVFNFFFYFYRKMYLIGGILLALWAVSMIPSFFIIWEYTLPLTLKQMGMIATVSINQAAVDHYAWLDSITRAIHMSIVLIFSFYANRIYYNKASSAVQAIHAGAEQNDQQDYAKALAQAGGTSKAAVIVVAALIIAAYFTVIAVMMVKYLSA